jgi:hypothetical protein
MANNQISKSCKGPISKVTSVISRHWNFSIGIVILKVRSQGNECRVDKM